MNSAGLYIHIPFCSSRCSYCDFATGIFQSELAQTYVGALVAEIEASPLAGACIDTIYFGGGTPSLLDPKQLERILIALHARFEIVSSPEITLEINPGSATLARLR